MIENRWTKMVEERGGTVDWESMAAGIVDDMLYQFRLATRRGIKEHLDADEVTRRLTDRVLRAAGYSGNEISEMFWNIWTEECERAKEAV